MQQLTHEEVEWLGRIALASGAVRTREHFFSWTQGPVQNLLPHEILICGFLDQGGGYRVERFSACRYFRQEHLDATVHPQGLLSEILASWQSQGGPILIGREYVRGPYATDGEDERLRRLELRNIATHALRWLDGSLKSYVSFARIMCPLDARLAHIIHVLAPMVSITLARVLAIEETAKQSDCLLSQRELEILEQVRNGLTNAEIASLLGISPLTVKNHVGNIIRKLDVRSRGHAVAKALSTGVLRSPAQEHSGKPAGRPAERGFALLWLLFVVAALGAGLAALGNVWHTVAVREKEKELLFVGDQYRRAIQSFYSVSSPGPQRYPKSIQELLEDPRFPNTVRYLRRPYPDPVTGSDQWGLVKAADGGISGVYSLSEVQPFKMDNFPLVDRTFAGKLHYSEWVFSALDKGGSVAGGIAGDGSATSPASSQTGADATTPGGASTPTPPPAQVSPCNQQLQQSLAACQQAVAAGQAQWGTCRNAALSAYHDCTGQ